ncbi:MAG: helix-turn-helix transcriptional regulator [Eubacteriales bacterium]|nr:helix-turn-helix transcriptional regulator [Eubacteriales bacterium]
MNLSEKIARLRKSGGMSQEQLAEKLAVSRQAVSRWESGSAMPDAANILQLSKLFGVTTDYLLNDDYQSDRDVPAVRSTRDLAARRIAVVAGLCVAAFGALGNLAIYSVSRFVEVMIPKIVEESGTTRYHWDSRITGLSYRYFVREYDLEFLVGLFWALTVAGVAAVVLSGKRGERLREKLRALVARRRK